MTTPEQRIGDVIAELDLHERFVAARLGWSLIGTDGASNADAAWRDVESWVEWLVETYEFTDWPTCWRGHGGLAQETIAMRVDHANAIARQHPRDLVTWHDHLVALRGRAAAVFDRCHGGKRCRLAPTSEVRALRSSLRGREA